MRRVRVEYHQDSDGSWWADSPDAPGFTAVADDEPELRRLAREGLYFFLDEEVVVEDDATVRAVVASHGRIRVTAASASVLLSVFRDTNDAAPAAPEGRVGTPQVAHA